MQPRVRTYAVSTAQSVLVISLFLATLFLSQYIASSENVRDFVAAFGYMGIFATSLISGFNAIVPIHAATFTPVFLAAGFPLMGIIITMIIGTTIADLASFWVGVIGKNFAQEKYRKQLGRLERMIEKRWWLPLAFLFVYAIAAPVPNELVLVPLAILGVPFHRVVLPLVAGNTIHLTLLNVGVLHFFAV